MSLLVIYLILGATLLGMVYFTIVAFTKFFEVKKELAEANTKIIYEKKFIQTNYDNDMKPLLSLIEEQCSNLSFTSLKEYYDSRNIINDKIFNDLVKNVTLSICTSISPEYKDLVSSYVSDVELFIYEKVYYSVLNIVIDINKRNISSLK